MATNIALKRAKKAQKRKQVVAQKRKLELVGSSSSLAVQARRAALGPIRACLQHGEIEGGMVTLIIARDVSLGRLVAAFFLVDLYCLGIKDVFLQDFGVKEFEDHTAMMAAEAPLTPVDPSLARKLVRDAAAWAAGIGFKPQRDFAAVEPIFGDIDPAACDVDFPFGQDGKPFYMPGPTETRAQVRERLAHLLNHLGEDGFEYAIAV